MQKRVVEETHLLQARSFVVAGTARIADLCLIIGRLRAHGLDTRQAEHCLQTMQETLTVIRGHKELIEEELARSRRVEARSRKSFSPARKFANPAAPCLAESSA